MVTTATVTPGIDVLTADIEIPGLGHLPINAYVLHGDAPVLVDTGSIAKADEFDSALRSVIDVADLRWIWLTHTDFDHIGLLHRLLAENPDLRVITTFFGVGIMGLFEPLPMDRVNFVNPGETITLVDRTLTAVKPPAFDNPITVGFHDDRTNAFFSADCFGALLPDGLPARADELSDAALRQGQVTWGTIDSSWMHKADPAVIAADLDRTRAVDPSYVLGAHLAPASGSMLDRMCDAVGAVPAAEPFAAPDQAVLDAMLAMAMAG
ncbi:MAG: oxygen-binding di-iron domain-containing protein [Acidimicrobiia bacterium]